MPPSISVERLEFHTIVQPLRFAYGHAKATHRSVEAVLCVAVDRAGNYGLGEAVPRAYVSGESGASVMADLRRLAPRLLAGTVSLASLRANIAELIRSWPGVFPSCALCALEGATLDLLARQSRCPLYHLFRPGPVEVLRYTASLGFGSARSVAFKTRLYLAAGFRAFKAKVGDAEDVPRLALIRRLIGPSRPLFADANGAWTKEEAVVKIEGLAALGVWAMEEPLRTADPPPGAGGQLDREAVLDDSHYQACHWIRRRSALPLIADESLISPASLERLLGHQAFDIVNVRLSKCGGHFAGAYMVERAAQQGLGYGFGAMVAESAVLANHGAHFGACHPERLYIQGYSHLALQARAYSSGGARLRLGATVKLGDAPGLGLRLNRAALSAISRAKETITL